LLSQYFGNLCWVFSNILVWLFIALLLIKHPTTVSRLKKKFWYFSCPCTLKYKTINLLYGFFIRFQFNFVLDQQQLPLAHLNTLIMKKTTRYLILKEFLKTRLLEKCNSGQHQLVDWWKHYLLTNLKDIFLLILLHNYTAVFKSS